MADPSPEGRRMAVRTELVKEFLVDRIHEAVLQRHGQPLPAAVEAGLAAAARTVDQGECDLGPECASGIARAGYLTRVVEVEMFEPARDVSALRAAGFTGGGPELSARLAAAEPSGRPAPDDPAATTWRVPGPGGHVRHYVAREAMVALGADDGSTGAAALAGKRCWLYGFFLRCCEEVAGADAIRSEG